MLGHSIDEMGINANMARLATWQVGTKQVGIQVAATLTLDKIQIIYSSPIQVAIFLEGNYITMYVQNHA